MESPHPTPIDANASRLALRIVALHVLFSALWILGSDALLNVLVADPGMRTAIQLVKGWCYVLVSGALIYYFVRRAFGGAQTSAAQALPEWTEHSRRSSWLQMAVAAVAVTALTAGAVIYTFAQYREQESARLQAVAELQARYVGDWLHERLAESRFINNSAQLATLYRQWRDGNDVASRDRLVERLVEFRLSTVASTMMVLNEHGAIVAREDGSLRPVEPQVREVALRALATGQPQHTGVYFHAGTELPLRIDFVVPLAHAGNATRGAVVMRIDPRATLFRILKNWPQASDTAESYIWRRVGDEVLAQSDFRSRPEAAGLLRFKAGETGLLVSRFLNGETPPGETAQARDYAGEEVLGAARLIPDSDWILIAKISTQEAYAGARHDAAWIITAGTLLLLAALAALWVARDWQNLRMTLLARAAEDRRAGALQLLDTLINSSPDVIYAKDLQGRYTLFNDEAERVSGKSRDDVLGRGDAVIFSPVEAAAVMANDAKVVEQNQTLEYEETLTTLDGTVVYSERKGPLRDASGKVIGIFGISRDVTQRQVAEAELHASEQRLRLFVEHAPAAIAMLDTQMRYIVVSRRWLRDYRLDERELMGLSHYDVFPDVPERWKLIHQRALQGELQSSEADAFVRADGSLDWVKWDIRPWRDAQGAIGGIMLFSEMVTARKQAEMALQELSDLVQAVSDSMVEQMAVLDREGVIVGVNAAWRQFGRDNPATDGLLRPRHAGVGDNYLAICHSAAGEAGVDGQHLRVIGAGIREVVEGLRTEFSLDYSFANSGPKRWFHLAATPLRTAAGGAVVLRSDITQRRLAEAALRDSEAHYRSMVSALSEGVVIFGVDCSVKEANPSAQAILGLAQTGPQGEKRVLTDWKPVRRDGTPCPYEELPLSRVFATGKPVHNVILGDTRPDGRLTWLLVNAEPVHDIITGELTAVVVSFNDVTERHAAEEQLRKLSMAVEQNPASIFITALDGTIEYVNETFVKVTGYSRDEVIGRNPRLLMSGQTPHAVFESLWQALTSGQPWRGEIVNRRKNGQLFTELSLIVPIQESGGRITHYLAMQDDITEQKDVQAELDRYRHHLEELVEQRTAQLEATNRALTDSERFVRAMTDNTPAAIAYWDRELRCRFANREYRARFGYGSGGEDITAKHISEVMGQADYESVRAMVYTALSGQAQHYQRVVDENSPDPVYYWVDFIPNLVNEEVQGFFVLSSNVTALKRAELRLQQANIELVAARDKAESANRAKSSFLANMSHEIRTPMNAIIGLTWLLRNDSRDPRDTARLGQVSEAAHHLLHVINDILDLSKIELGKLVLEDIDFQLDALLSRTCALVAGRARAKGLELRVDTDHLPTLLRGDPTRLSQALINLLGNAVKFTGSGFIELRGDLLEEVDDTLLVRFSVRDSGIGVAAETLDTLFDAFVQADNSITRRHDGTGLGLAITRHLAELMGGTVGVRSELGQGSTFWFTARLRRAQADPAVPLPDTPGRRYAADALRRDHGGQRVLVAEDNPVNQDVAVELLRAAGLHVDVAANGLQAVEMAQHQAYALILMDMQMPEMDGLRATRAIRQFPQHAETAILSLSANVFGEDQLSCMEAGMNGHLAKPVDPQLLYEALLCWLPARPPQAADTGDAPPAPYAPATDGAPATARPWLSGIPGFDAERGEQLIGGDTTVYLRLLRQFMHHYDDGLSELPGLLARGELDAARLMAHSLKGASATVGAERIRAGAAALEAALRSGAALGDLQDAAVQLRHALSLLLQALGERLAHVFPPESAQAAAPSPHDPDARGLLDALQALLEGADFGAAVLYRQARTAIRHALGEGPVLDALEQSIEQHDHPAALRHLLMLRGAHRDDGDEANTP